MLKLFAQTTVKHCFAGQVNAAFLVDFRYFDNDFVADGNNVFNLADMFGGKLADMNQTFFAGQDFNKCAEVHQAGNFAGVNFADFRFGGNAVNDINSFGSLLAVDSGNVIFQGRYGWW